MFYFIVPRAFSISIKSHLRIILKWMSYNQTYCTETKIILSSLLVRYCRVHSGRSWRVGPSFRDCAARCVDAARCGDAAWPRLNNEALATASSAHPCRRSRRSSRKLPRTSSCTSFLLSRWVGALSKVWQIPCHQIFDRAYNLLELTIHLNFHRGTPSIHVSTTLLFSTFALTSFSRTPHRTIYLIILCHVFD